MGMRIRYALPNAVTCLSIVAALLSIAESVAGRFDSAAWFVLLCVLLDKADGTVARLLKASSRFGIEMDSLSDLCAFGVAPAVLTIAYLVGPSSTSLYAGELWFRIAVYSGCALFVIASALRLAKFNVLTDVYGKEFFFGIPTTFCGGFSCAYFLTARKYVLPPIAIEILPALFVLLAFLMVSRVPLPKINKRKTLAMNVFQMANLVLIYVCGLLRVFPEYLLAISLVYLVPGTVWASAKGIKPPALDVHGQPLQPPSPAADRSAVTEEEPVAAENLPVGQAPLVQVEREK
jgi:CDP-diacylglycerol--serine O-phosphatidyltransferase